MPILTNDDPVLDEVPIDLVPPVSDADPPRPVAAHVARRASARRPPLLARWSIGGDGRPGRAWSR